MKILETTLRDGSYAIDFQFTAEDTMEIGAVLEDFGFELIEIGHGVGLGASRSGKGVAVETDEDYLKAGSLTFKKSKWGMFFIPGTGTMDDIALAADYGMNVIRVGTNITELEKAEKFIQFAKRKGMFVSSNLMKSYALPPKGFAEKVKQAGEYGVDIAVLVDSAGCMLPADVREYFEAAREISDVPLGFHGHNNLQLAIANTITAIDCGAEIVDSSLMGLGRSAGNAHTEILLMILKKMKLYKEFDINRIMDFSERVIKPMRREWGLDSYSLVTGYAGFHSSYLGTILSYADKYKIDPRELIVELCKKDVVNAPADLVEELAAQLARQERRSEKLAVGFSRPAIYFERAGKKERSFKEALEAVVSEVRNLALKTGKASIINVVIPYLKEPRDEVSHFIQESFGFVIGSLEVCRASAMGTAVKAADGRVDYVFLDAEPKCTEHGKILQRAVKGFKKSKLLLYKDNDVWVQAVADMIVEESKEKLTQTTVLIAGRNNLSFKLCLTLKELGMKVFLWDRRAISGFRMPAWACFGRGLSFNAVKEIARLPDADIIVGMSPGRALVGKEFLSKLKPGGLVIDAGIDSISPDFVEGALEDDVRIVRTDMRAALSAEVEARINTSRLVGEIRGRTTVGGRQCVAGGIYGREGDLVLDSITSPVCVVGISDGRGGVRYRLSDEEEMVLREVRAELKKRKWARDV